MLNGLPPLRQMFVLDTQLYERHLRRALDKQKKFTDETERGMGRASSSMGQLEKAGGRVNKMWMRMTQLAVGFAAVMAAKFSIGNMIRLSAQLEAAHIQFTTLLGDAKEADKVLDQLFRFTEKTPFQFDDVQNSARILLAFGTGAHELEDTLTRLGDIAAGTGSNLNDIARIYGKIRVNGIAQMQEVNQLQDKGIAIVERLAGAWGKTNLEVRKMVENAQVGFEDIRMVINQMTEEGGQFAGGMNALSMSLNGMMSTLKDKLDAILRSVGSDIFSAVKADVTGLLNAMNELEESGELDKWADRIGLKIRSMYEGIKSATRFIIEHREQIARVIQVYVGFRAAQIAIAASTRLWALGTVALNAAMSAYKMVLISMQYVYAMLTGNIRLAKNAQVALNLAFKASPWGVLATVILAVGAALFLFAKRTDEAAAYQKALQDELRETTKEIENMSGAMLKQQQVSLQARQQELYTENRQANNEAQLLKDAIAEAQEFATSGAQPRVGADGTVSSGSGGRTFTDDESKRLVELEKQRAEIGRELTINMAQQHAIAAQLRGDIEKQIEFIEEENRLISAGVDMTKEQQQAFDANIIKVRELRKILDERRGTSQEPGEVRTFGPDEREMDRASKLLETTEAQIQRAAELAGTNRELHSTLKEIYDLSDLIAKLETQAGAVAGTDKAAQLMAQAGVLREQRTELQGRVSDYRQFNEALEVALETARELGDETIGLDIDTDSIDPIAVSASILQQLEAVQDIIDQKSSIQLKLKQEGLSDDDVTALNAELKGLQDQALTETQALINLVAEIPGVSDEARTALIKMIESLTDTDAAAGVEEFQQSIAKILEPFENQTLRVKVEGEGTPELTAKLETLRKQTVEKLRAAFEALPADIKESNAALQMMAQALRMVGEQAESTDLDKFLSNSARVANTILDVANAIELTTGKSVDGLRKTADMINNIAGSMAQLNSSLAMTNASGALTAAGTLGVIGAVASLAAIVGGVIYSARDDRGERAARAMEQHQEATERHREELERNRVALYDSAKMISDSLRTMLGGEQVGQDLERRDILNLQEVIDRAQKGLFDVYNDDRADFRDPNDPDDVFKIDPDGARETVFNFLDELERLDIGIDVESLRDHMRELRMQGEDWTTVLDTLINGGDELGYSLQGLIDQYEAAAGAFAEGADGIVNRSRFRERFLGQGQGENLGETIGDISALEGLGEGFRDLLDAIGRVSDPESESGQAEIKALVQAAMERLAAGGATDLIGDMAPGEIMRLLELLFGFGDASDEAADSASTLSEAMSAAGRAASLVADLLDGSVSEAFTAYVESLRASGGTPDFIKKLLPEGLDLSSPEGLQALQALITDTALAIQGGDYSEAERVQLQSLLDVLSGFAQQAGADGETSRSVSAIQSLTDYTGTEMLMALVEISYDTRRGADAGVASLDVLKSIAGILGHESFDLTDEPISFSKQEARSVTLNMPVDYHEGDPEQVIREMTRKTEQAARRVFGQSKRRVV